MPRKQTSAKVSAIAGKYVGDESPLSAFSDQIAAAVRECGVPLNDRAILVLQNRIETAIAPLLDDLKSLAGSCLGQDEAPPIVAD